MKALIIEDNTDIISFLRRGLQYENFLVDTAIDGETGLEKALNNHYDILIVDLLLPKLDGADFLRAFRKKDSSTPVIILTAIRDDETSIKLLDLGADDYLRKPFSFGELTARMRAILRRTKGLRKKEVVMVDDLIVDPFTREVSRGGKNIKLRKKEFALLEFLINHQNEVVSHATILEDVWDFNSDAMSNTVGSHVSSLRRKIDRGHKKNLIHTVHGVGYKFSPANATPMSRHKHS